MLADRFNAAARRLEALRGGQAKTPGLVDRALGAFSRPSPQSASLEPLLQLDGELERSGVHTAADARLLRDLGASHGRLGALSRDLSKRAAEALTHFEAALTTAEQRVGLDDGGPARLRALDDAYPRLGRIVKVATIFAGQPAAAGALLGEAARPPSGAPDSPRLAIAEFLVDRARRSVEDVGRKRRDLDVASELVLRMGVDARVERQRLRHLRVQLAAARERVRSAPLVRSFGDLWQHLRHAARSEPRTAYRSLRALYDRAAEAGDEALAGAAAEALGALTPKESLAALVERDETRRLLGVPTGGVEALPAGGKGGVTDAVDDVLAQLAFGLDDDARRALELAAGCSRYFDVEDALTTEQVEAQTRSARPVFRQVPYPTERMTYEFTNRVDDVERLVVSNPGTLVLDLAAGRQMVRTYLEAEPQRRPKRGKRTAVRVYVLDASGSMHGSRARFRDAILIAELNAIRVKAGAGLPFDPLYFSYFNDVPTALTRVETGEEATWHITRLFSESPAEGQTDISLALMAAFDSIGNAQGRDPYLARATVVLVTDGEDRVDLELIRKTKRPYEGLEIDLSFIALGEENEDLKTLVLEQRQGGARAFYQHLSDGEIRLAKTDFDSAWRTLLPADVPLDDETLERLLPHLEALEAAASRRAPEPVEANASQFDALFPPAVPAGGAGVGGLTERLADVLEAVNEAASLAPAERRSAEAVTLLMHLLGLYGVAPARYFEALQAGGAALSGAVARVRLTCRPFS